MRHDDPRRFSFELPRRERQKPGKKPHPIWSNFDKVGEPKTHPDASCTRCKVIAPNGKPSSNLKSHLLWHCKAISEFDKERVRAMFNMRPEPYAGLNAAPTGTPTTQPVLPPAPVIDHKIIGAVFYEIFHRPLQASLGIVLLQTAISLYSDQAKSRNRSPFQPSMYTSSVINSLLSILRGLWIAAPP
jgi:hypothetical protein